MTDRVKKSEDGNTKIWMSSQWKVFKVFKLFKACVRYSLSNFYFSPNDNPSCFLFHLKSSVHSWNIQIFVFLHFLLVSHCLRSWSKKNLKVYDGISCLSKNLIKHFDWYLEKKIRCDIETLSNDRELNKEQFLWKIMWKICIISWSQTPF